jgi:hypothetical protein
MHAVVVGIQPDNLRGFSRDVIMLRTIVLRTVVLRAVVLRQAGRPAGFVYAFALIVACFVAGQIYAQTKPEDPAAANRYLPAPPLDFTSKEKILCAARMEVYEKQRCDQSCTDECKSIGESLKECQAPKIACTR